MAFLRNRQKLAALSNISEEHPKSKLAQNSTVPRSQQDYITQVSEEFEGRVTKKLSRLRSSVVRRVVFWALYPNLMNFFWNR